MRLEIDEVEYLKYPFLFNYILIKKQQFFSFIKFEMQAV